MPIYLKLSTASQEVPLGYFLDSTDGNSEETGLTIANTDIKVWKTGATTLASKNSGGGTHISTGIYYAVLDATDSDTLGPLVLFVHVAGALAVRVECCVLAANIYDSLIGGGDILDVSTTQFNGTAATASGGRPEVNTTHAAGTAWGSGAITAASIAADAITAAKVADGTIDAATFATGAITAASLATDAGAEIADAVWDEARSGHTTAGTFGSTNQPFDEGTAQAVAASTITLATSAPAVTNQLLGDVVYIRSATTGAGQAGQITGYTSGRVATVSPVWNVALTGTVVYEVYPAPATDTAASLAAAVRTELATELARIDVANSTRSDITIAQVNTEVDTALGDAGVTSGRQTKLDTLPGATAGTNGGLFIAGTNAATSITTALTANIVGNVTGNLSGSVGSVTGAVGSVTGAVGSVTGAVGSVTGNVGGNVVGTVASVVGAVGSVTGHTPQTGDTYARLGAPAGASVSADVAAVKVDSAAIKLKTDALPSDPADASDIATAFSSLNTKVDTIDDLLDTEMPAATVSLAAIKAKTDNLPASPAAVGSAMTLSTAGYEAAADAFLNRNINQGGNGTRTVEEALATARNKIAIVGSTLTVYDVDDTAVLFTAAIATASRSPLASVDPA